MGVNYVCVAKSVWFIYQSVLIIRHFTVPTSGLSFLFISTGFLIKFDVNVLEALPKGYLPTPTILKNTVMKMTQSVFLYHVLRCSEEI